MKKYDDLAKIAELRDRGVLSEEEFQQEKSKILQDEDTSFARFFQPPPGEELLFGLKEDMYCMLLHLSQFLIVFPPFGIAVPILLWFLGKEKSEWVDRHGRVIFNWWISFLIYFVISAVLASVIIGVYLMLALVACAIIFPIVCAVKASEGIIWTYPLSIDFFGVKNFSPKKAENQSTTPEQTPHPKDVEPPQNDDMHFNAGKYQSPSIAEKYR